MSGSSQILLSSHGGIVMGIDGRVLTGLYLSSLRRRICTLAAIMPAPHLMFIGELVPSRSGSLGSKCNTSD